VDFSQKKAKNVKNGISVDVSTACRVYSAVRRVYYTACRVYSAVRRVYYTACRVYSAVRRVYYTACRVYSAVRRVYYTACRVYSAVRRVYYTASVELYRAVVFSQKRLKTPKVCQNDPLLAN
jgi:hypothetical protein